MAVMDKAAAKGSQFAKLKSGKKVGYVGLLDWFAVVLK